MNWRSIWAKLKNYWLSLSLVALFSGLLSLFGLIGGYNDLKQVWSELFPAPILSLQITPKDQLIHIGDRINLTYAAADYGYLSLWQQELNGAATRILPQTAASTLKLDASWQSRTLFDLQAEGQADRVSFILLWTEQEPEHLAQALYPNKAAFETALQALKTRTEVLQETLFVEIHARP